MQTSCLLFMWGEPQEGLSADPSFAVGTGVRRRAVGHWAAVVRNGPSFVSCLRPSVPDCTCSEPPPSPDVPQGESQHLCVVCSLAVSPEVPAHFGVGFVLPCSTWEGPVYNTQLEAKQLTRTDVASTSEIPIS